MALLTNLADAVRDALNVHEFSQQFVAIRYACAPVLGLKDLGTLHVSVVPKGWTCERASRSQLQAALQVDVAVQKRLAGGGSAELDALMGLVEEIVCFLSATGFTLAGDLTVVPVAAENTPLYAPEDLSDLEVFTSAVSMTYRAMM